MEISSPSLPQAVAAARLALTDALVLKVGQTLEALVVGKAADGATELKIGDTLVIAKLAQNFAVGTTLQLQVKSGGAAAHLAILAVRMPTGVAGPLRAGAPTRAGGPGVVSAPVGTAAGTAGAVARPVVAPGAETVESVPSVTVESSQTESKPVSVGRAVAPAAFAEPPGSGTPSVAVTPVAAQAPNAAGSGVRPTASQVPAAEIRPGAIPDPVPAALSGPTVATTIAAEQPPQGASLARLAGAISQAGIMSPNLTADAGGRGIASPLPTADDLVVPATLPEGKTQVEPQRLAVALPGPAGPEAEAQNALLLAQETAHPQTSMVAMPRSVAVSTSTVPSTPVSLRQTPQAAVAHMLPEALARQDSIGPLLRTLAAVLQAPVALPEPIVRAVIGLLAQRIPVPDGKVAAGDLEQAVNRSGVGLEALLARGQSTVGDAKAGVLALRDMLGKWASDGKPATPPHDPAPPPLKGLTLRAPVAPEIGPVPEAARDVGKLLHAQADAAVSRIKLMQVASLPDADPKLSATATLRVEVPFLVGHELVMAQIQIAREGRRREAEQRRGWTMRFALNFSATGEVGAEVGLLGRAVNVSLWAIEPETAEALADGLPELQRALEAIGLDPGPIRMRLGAPEPERLASGRLVDSVS